VSIKVIINGCPLEIFEGATVGDAVRKFSPDTYRFVKRGDSTVTDLDGNTYYLTGQLVGGEVFRIEKRRDQEGAMSKSKSIFIISTVIILAILALGIYLAAEEKTETRITIFHLNDIHGGIDNMGKVAHLVNLERSKNPNVFLVHSGDNFSGNPIVDQYEPKGEPLLILMNKMKFSAGVIGNHDFDYGKKVLKSFIQRANFPMLLSNVKSHDPGFPQPAPHQTFKLENGPEVIFLGLIQTEEHSGLPSTLPANVEGLEFFEGTEYALKFRHLKKADNVFIALSHLGFGKDKILAGKMGELDVIIGGHSHTLVEHPSLENGVLVAQAGARLDYLGRVDITLRDGRITGKSGSVIDLDTVKESDSEIDRIVKDFNEKSALGTALADIGTTISGRHDLGLMVTDAIRKELGLDIIFYNRGGIRINRLSGKVTAKEVYTMHPFGNYIVEMVMDTAEIKDLIRNDYEGHRGLDILPSGLTYRITRDLNKKVKNVELFDLEGYPIPDGKKFRVGMNNYIVSSYKFTHRDPGRSTNAKTVDIMLRFFSSLKDRKLDYTGKVRAEEKIIYSGKVTVLGKAETDIYTARKKFYKNSPTGNLAADAMRRRADTDIAFYPTRLLRNNITIPRGQEVYREALPDLYGFIGQSKVLKVKMTGSQIGEFVLRRVSDKNNIDLQISGGTYTIRLGRDNRVKGIDLTLDNGKKLRPEAIYTAALLEYDFNNFYSIRKAVKPVETYQENLEEMISAYITKQKGVPAETAVIRITMTRNKNIGGK